LHKRRAFVEARVTNIFNTRGNANGLQSRKKQKCPFADSARVQYPLEIADEQRSIA
jgi:ribosome modulation factor